MLIDKDQCVKSSFTNAQTWKVRQEVITHEEAKEDKVVNDLFKLELERNLDVLELEVKVLTDDGDFHILEHHELLLFLLLWVVLLISAALVG